MDQTWVRRGDVRNGQFCKAAAHPAARCLVGALLAAAVLCGLADKARAVAPAFAPDKLTHFSFGVPCGIGGALVVNYFAPEYRLPGGALLGTAPGLLVEILDSTGSAGFSGGDLLADFVGSTLGALVTDQVILRVWYDHKGGNTAGGVEVGGQF